jgi:hypothetical protein
MKIKQPKRRGEWVELRFMAAAAENDMNVTRPWGDSAQYDFIVEHQGRFLRIQVKSTQFFDRGCYPCAVKGSHWPYAENVFDFLAVYILPEDLWYIIPAHAFRGQASVAPAASGGRLKICQMSWRVGVNEASAGDADRTGRGCARFQCGRDGTRARSLSRLKYAEFRDDALVKRASSSG